MKDTGANVRNTGAFGLLEILGPMDKKGYRGYRIHWGLGIEKINEPKNPNKHWQGILGMEGSSDLRITGANNKMSTGA